MQFSKIFNNVFWKNAIHRLCKTQIAYGNIEFVVTSEKTIEIRMRVMLLADDLRKSLAYQSGWQTAGSFGIPRLWRGEQHAK